MEPPPLTTVPISSVGFHRIGVVALDDVEHLGLMVAQSISVTLSKLGLSSASGHEDSKKAPRIVFVTQI